MSDLNQQLINTFKDEAVEHDNDGSALCIPHSPPIHSSEESDISDEGNKQTHHSWTSCSNYFSSCVQKWKNKNMPNSWKLQMECTEDSPSSFGEWKITLPDDVIKTLQLYNNLSDPEPEDLDKILETNKSIKEFYGGILLSALLSICQEEESKEQALRMIHPIIILMKLPTRIAEYCKRGYQGPPLSIVHSEMSKTKRASTDSFESQESKKPRLSLTQYAEQFVQVIETQIESDKWLQINGVRLCYGDAKYLAPLKLMNDNVIDAMLFIICRESRIDQNMIPALFMPIVPLYLYLSSSEDESTHVDLIQILKNDKEAIFILFPIQIHSMEHYVVAVANKLSKQVVFFDPYQPIGYLGEGVHDAVRVLDHYVIDPASSNLTINGLSRGVRILLINHLKKIDRLLNMAFEGNWDVLSLNVEWPFNVQFNHEPDLPPQADCFSCGVLVISFLEKLLNRPVFCTDENIDALKCLNKTGLRIRLFKEIVENRDAF